MACAAAALLAIVAASTASAQRPSPRDSASAARATQTHDVRRSRADTLRGGPITPVTTDPPPLTEPPRRRFTNGFYVGIGAGASVPTGGVRNAYDMGYGLALPFGWDAPAGPLGLQGELTYNNLGARSTFRNVNQVTGATSAVTTVNPQIWSALADVKVRLPVTGQFLAGGTTGFYVLGGGGVHWLRNYGSTFAVTNPGTNINAEGVQTSTVSSGGSLTRFGLNAGAGATFAIARTELFVEARYVRILTSAERTSYVPIMLGVTIR